MATLIPVTRDCGPPGHRVNKIPFNGFFCGIFPYDGKYFGRDGVLAVRYVNRYPGQRGRYPSGEADVYFLWKDDFLVVLSRAEQSRLGQGEICPSEESTKVSAQGCRLRGACRWGCALLKRSQPYTHPLVAPQSSGAALLFRSAFFGKHAPHL